MNWKRLLILIAAFILYLVVGALVFSTLETTNEETTRVDLREYKAAILNNLTCLSEEILEEFISKIVHAIDSGLSPVSNVTGSTHWDFSSSFFFSGTVVTTIGYGNISPTTTGGRAFCIVYALIGIPLFGIFMAAISEKLKKQAHQFEERLGQRLVQHPKAKSSIYAASLLTICLLFFMIIPAAIFAHIEKWTFFEAFYYSFITLTTIGFGDFVIGTNPDIDYHVLYKWGTYCWIFIGLALLALIIAFIADLFVDTADKIQQKQEERKKKQQTGVSAAEEEDLAEGRKEDEKSEARRMGWKAGSDNSTELKDLTDTNGVVV